MYVEKNGDNHIPDLCVVVTLATQDDAECRPESSCFFAKGALVSGKTGAISAHRLLWRIDRMSTDRRSVPRRKRVIFWVTPLSSGRIVTFHDAPIGDPAGQQVLFCIRIRQPNEEYCDTQSKTFHDSTPYTIEKCTYVNNSTSI